MLVTLAFVLGAAWAAPAREECPAVLEAAGVSPIFAPLVAHNIHSLTLEDIRYFFKEDATEENGIPTVNMDLSSDKRVLPNAPLAGYDEDFSTYGIKAFDRVMRNMNRTWWGIENQSVLDRVYHAFHMAEIWDHAAKQYKIVEKLLDPQSDICDCITDVENNDVMNYLNLLAFQMKYPGITTGNKTLTDAYLTKREKRSVHMDKPVYTDHIHRRFTLIDFGGVNFELSDVELLKDVAEQLIDGADVTSQRLDSVENYEILKELSKHGLEREGYYDVAVFMFCKLNRE